MITESGVAAGLSAQAGGFLQDLHEVFHASFALIDVADARLLRATASTPSRPWLDELELYAQVARQGSPEVVIEDGPLAILALPTPYESQSSQVAAGLFVTDCVQSASDIEEPAFRLGLDVEETVHWAMGQTPWRPAVLQQMGQLVADKWRAQRDARKYRGEVDHISTHLLSTYEELSMLHRLTQNLKLSSSEAELGRQAMAWLTDVVPAEGFAIRLTPVGSQTTVSHEVRTEAMFLVHGHCPVDQRDFDEFIQHLGQKAQREPIVLNRAVTDRPDWPYPAVREVISVPLEEGGKTFGWLLAVNHRDNEEFGTVEASLMGSVAGILGIHAGNISLYREQAELLSGVVRALTSAIDAKDPYTCGHSDRVARIAVRLAEELGCDKETLNTIYLSGLLHDIGKIGIDDSVLRKPGKLTAAEYEHIKLHPELGYKILRDLKQLDHVLPVVLHHHEAVNGKGYPHGLAGDEIPLLARIVAVADSFDAMSSDRPYRKGMPIEELDDILQHGAGAQWDAEVVDAYFRSRDDILAITEDQHGVAGATPLVEQWA
jgi:putative nucleotidyltransferase with HDIG domain